MNKALLAEFAADVASALTAETDREWKVSPEDTGVGVTLAGPGGAKVWLTTWRTPGRVEIHGTYPQNAVYPNPETVTISVAENRGATIIAREIKRRVLPTYTEELTRVHKDNEERNLARAARIELARELAEMVATVPYKDERWDASRTEIRFYLSREGLDALHGDITVNYRADSVKLELNGLTPTQAKAILRIAREGTGMVDKDGNEV